MEIFPHSLLTNFLLKNHLQLNIPAATILEKSSSNQLEISFKDNKLITIGLTQDGPMEIPLERILEELEVETTNDNLLLLKMFLKNKTSLSKNKFINLSRVLRTIPQYKEEFLEILLNPFLHLIIFNNSEPTKTSIFLPQNKANADQLQEITILYEHPQVDQILIEIFWQINPFQPQINFYFSKPQIHQFFVDKIIHLEKRLPAHYTINLLHLYSTQEKAEKSKINYYKLDLKI